MLSRDDLLRHIRTTVHHPATARELARILRIPRDERHRFARDLKALVADGLLLQLRGNRFGLAEKMDVVAGRLQANAGGFGFVVPEQGDAGPRADVYIAAPNLMDAMHGDRVVARIERQSDRKSTRLNSSHVSESRMPSSA